MILSILLMILMLMLLLLSFSLKGNSLSLEFESWNFLSLEMIVDQSILVFLVLLLGVFFCIMLFSGYYLSGEKNLTYYSWVMMVFVLKMVILLVSEKLFLILVGWDLLGVSSFLLVNFYGTWDSINSSMITVMSNRVGDFFLFLLMIGMLQFSSLSSSHGVLMVIPVFALIITSFTKSAQFPFSGWLPKAMAAPTPVKALVHSSTLVTAGLLLLFKFKLLILEVTALNCLFWIGLMTLVIASLLAFVEEDVKKVVALSTLSQMGLAVLTMGLGAINLSIFHLISHGFFKSLLFIQVGYLMHQAAGQQDPRDYLHGGRVDFFIQLQLLVSLFKLCGLFFTNGLVTKDLIIELWWGFSFGAVVPILFFFSIVFTFFYAFRLWKALFMSSFWSVSYYQGSVLMKFLSIFLMICSISFMWWVSSNLVHTPSFFIYSDLWAPLVFLLVFMTLMRFSFNSKLSFFISKFQTDYFILNSRWSLMNFKSLENLSYKKELSLISSISNFATFLNLYLFSSVSWLVFIFILVFMFW